MDKVEYPFPSGLYLSRLIFLTRSLAPSNPLLRILTDPCLGNKYTKEISEAMSMVDCVERAAKLVFMRSIESIPIARVFVVGDGKRPLCASAMCLHQPSWRYYSIDPLLEITDLAEYNSSIFQFSGLSQDFVIPPTTENGESELSIIIACHSHAPLAEFWSRVTSPKLCITMPCCSNYSDLPGIEPLCTFDDYEVYSPKRRIKIYSEI